MSDRERWTVYPLLFLALGVAAKDKLFRQLDVDQVSCKALVVKDRENRDRVVIDTDSIGGRMRMTGNREVSLVLGYQNNVVGLMFADGRGNLALNRGMVMSSQPPARPRVIPQKPAAEPGPNPQAVEPAEPDDSGPK
jgi:hypothetical protein